MAKLEVEMLSGELYSLKFMLMHSHMYSPPFSYSTRIMMCQDLIG